MDLYTLVTNIGKAKIANAAVLGKKVDFSKLKVGDGNGNYYEPSESQTNLVHKVWEGNVNNVLTGGEKNPNWIVVQTMIPPGEGGFYIRECGLFDEEDNLLAISKYPESYKPTMDEGSTDDLTIELIFEVSNAATINLKIDPLVTLASLQNLYDLESKTNKKIETLSTRLNDLTSDSYPIVEATGTNAYIGASSRIKAVGKGTRCTLFVGTASNGNCSLNLNNSGAVAIKDSNGNVVTNMKANIPYNLCHNGSDFILQGKGGGGNLIPKYLLAGYYGEGDNGRVDGAMVNRGAPTSNLNCGGVVNLQEGYYAGGQIIANSLASQTGGATADDTKVLNGYKYWKDGVLRTGNATIQSLGGGTDIQCNPVRYRSSSNMPTGTYVIDAREFKILNPYYISDSNARCCVAISGELRSSTGLKNITDFVQSTRGTQYVTIYSSDSENVSKYGYLDGYCFWLILR